MRTHRRTRVAVTLSTAVLATAGSLIGLSTDAFALGQFNAGDLVVYETQGLSSNAQSVDLVDYSPTTGLPGFSVALPTTDGSGQHALTESGGALNDGELTLSADGQSLIATGYDATVGTASVTSASGIPRTVAIVGPTGTVDTTTSITNGTIEAQNFRSATTAVTGGNIYLGSGGGAGITTGGSSSATFLTGDKVHEVLVANNQSGNPQLYESTTKNIYSIGSGLPTSGSPTTTALLSGASLPTNFGPDQFAFVTLGNGPNPDTLYVADGSNGATSGEPNAVEKYSLESGVWTATGSVTVPLVAGLAATVSNGVATIYVTGATSTSAANNTILDTITDSSGFGGTLSGTPTLLATAPTGTDFKGLAWAPVATGNGLPESPLAIGLPLVAALGLAGYIAVRRRRQVA